MNFKNFGRKVLENGKEVLKKDTVRVKTKELNLNVPYGEVCDIPDEYAQPRRYANGGRRPSPIEMLAPQLQPADDAARESWLQVPPESPKVKAEGHNPVAMSVEALVSQGIPRGVAETLVATYQAALAATKAAVEEEK